MKTRKLKFYQLRALKLVTTGSLKRWAAFLFMIFSVFTLKAQAELNIGAYSNVYFTCDLGTYISERTTAKNIDSRVRFSIPSYSSRPHLNYSDYERFIKYHVYISSNDQLDNDVKIHEFETSSFEINIGNGRRQYQYPGISGSLLAAKMHVGNGWFGNKMYIIITRQTGRRRSRNQAIQWSSESNVRVHEFDLIERAFVDPKMVVTQAPPSPGSWNYQFKFENIGTVRARVLHNWRMRLVRSNGTSTTLASGRRGAGQNVNGTVYISPELATPGFPSDFIYFELLPVIDHNRTNNTVKTPFIF